MKKVGLITFHQPINFGAALQSVALSKAIESCGCRCEILNYINPTFKKNYKVFSFKSCHSFKQLIWNILMVPFRIKQKIQFSNFIKMNACLTRKYNKKMLSNASKEYDMFFTGSDQVWNYKCSGKDASYFLDFVENKPKVSYAASFGDFVVSEQYKKEYANYISDMSAISVRESSGADIVKQLTGRDALQCLDPTLLLDAKQWGDVIKCEDRICKEPYILVYFMAQSSEIKKHIFEVAQKLKNHYGYSIVVIGGSLHKEKGEIKYCNVSSPETFLALFRDASYVLTNSFHGTAFAVNFKKNFYSYVKPDLEVVGRVESLLNAINLKDRIFSYAKEINIFSDVDYDANEHLLNAEVEKSYQYIKEVVQKCPKGEL